MNEEQNQNLQAAAKKLEQLDIKMNEAVQSTRRKNILGLVASIILIVLVGGYLIYAYREFSGVNPDLAAQVTQSHFESYLPGAGNELERKLIESAPAVITEGEKRLLQLPDQLAANIQTQVEKKLDDEMPQMEKDVYAALKASLDQQLSAPRTAGEDDEKRFKTLLDNLAAQTPQRVDQIHEKYASQGDEIINALEVLADNQNLDEEQKLHREMFRTFLILARQYQKKASQGTDLTTTAR